MGNPACRKPPSPSQEWIQHKRVINPTALSEEGQSLLQSRLRVPHTHDDGAVSRATVQLVPAMTSGHKVGSLRDSAMCRVPPSSSPGTGRDRSCSLTGPRLCTPTPEQPQFLWEARLPLEQGAKLPTGDQERKPGHGGDQRDTLFVHFSRAKMQDAPLMPNLAHAGQRMGIVRVCSGAPGLSPPSPGPHSPLDAESQHNSIMTLQGLLALVCGTGVPHLTENTRQRLEWDVSTHRRNRLAVTWALAQACRLG